MNSEELEPKTLQQSFLASCLVSRAGRNDGTPSQGSITAWENHCSRALGIVMGQFQFGTSALGMFQVILS